MSADDRIARLGRFVARLPEPKRPPLVLPEELGVKIEDIFHHIDPRQVPGTVDVLEYLMEHDPSALAAIGDVDRTLIWSMLEMSPAERLAYNERTSSSIVEMQEAMERVLIKKVA